MKFRDFFIKILIDKDFKGKLAFLRSVSLFSDLSSRALGEVLSISYEKQYTSGDFIFEEGRPGKALYIVKSGEVSIIKNGKELLVLKSGDFFGEMALLEETPRSAGAKAHGDCVLLLIYKVKFDALIENNPSVGIKIIRRLSTILSARLRQTSESYLESLCSTGKQ